MMVNITYNISLHKIYIAGQDSQIGIKNKLYQINLFLIPIWES